MPKKIENPQLIKTYCQLCGSDLSQDYQIIYPANLSAQDFNPQIFSARRLPDRLHYQFVKCKHDGLVRSHPVLSADVLSQLYADSKFTYQSEVANLQATYLSALAPILSQVNHQDKILEIGCGNGFMLDALSKQGFTDLQGVEPSHDAISQASTKIKPRIKPGFFAAKHWPARSFSLIMMFQTLDHFADPNQVLEDCYQLLKRGGFIFSFHHNIDSWSHRLIGERHPIIDIEHLNLFSPHTTAKLFEKHGFLVTKVTTPINIISLGHLCWLLPLPQIIKKFILTSASPFLKSSFRVKLGNIAIIAQKP